MPVSSPLTPKSVLRHRPLDADKTMKERPTVPRASHPSQRRKETVQPFVCSPQKMPVRKEVSHFNLVSLGVGMMLALAAVLLGQLALGWLGTTWDDLRYGRPRTYQIDAFVGHETGRTPSHFIVLNLHSRIEVLELPGGDPTRTKIYIGPFISGPGADLVPVTIRFVDSRKTHHPDMLILFQSTQIVFHNVQNTFQVGGP